MKFYLEFDGNILNETECFNYQQVGVNILKIISQCMLRLKSNRKRNISPHEELLIKDRILAKLKIVRSKSKWGAIKFEKNADIHGE